jgi:hypothetical protein
MAFFLISTHEMIIEVREDAPMAFTQVDLDAINKAIAAGELSIGLGDMRITYRSMTELLQARDTIQADLAAQATTARAYPRHQTASFADD